MAKAKKNNPHRSAINNIKLTEEMLDRITGGVAQRPKPTKKR